MLLSLALLLAPSRIWEKPVAPGLSYREEVDLQTPRMIHILRFSPGGVTRATCELGGGVIYKANPTKGRGTVTEMVQRTGAVAGINGDFFPFTGDPLGLMLHEGRLISLPYFTKTTPPQSRAAFFWNDKASQFGNSFRFDGTVKIANREALILDGLNQEAAANQLCLETPTAALARGTAPNIHLVIRMTTIDESPTGTCKGEVRAIFKDQTNVPVPAGNVVLTASGTKVASLATALVGEPVSIQFKLDGLDLPDAQEAIGGGPVLVHKGRIAVDALAEGFDASFSGKTHPRTAIGRRSDGEIWFVVVDGRQKVSEGMSLNDLAAWFLEHGCTEAINLDGGGSSAMNLFGALVNRPSDGAERPVANGVLFYASRPAGPPPTGSIHSPKALHVGESIDLKVVTSKGEVVPNAEVIWGCTGATAWIDQGGTLHGVSKGPATVTGSFRGALVTINIQVG